VSIHRHSEKGDPDSITPGSIFHKVFNWFIQTLEPGTSQNAVLTIYALSACTGVLPVFFIIYANGAFVGFLLLLGVAVITGVVSWMLSQAAEHYNARTCEEIALRASGPKLAAFTSVVMICAQVGFVVGYMVVLKSLLPETI
jgi:amino acid permease